MGSVRLALWAPRCALVASLALLPFTASAASSKLQELSAKVDALSAQVAQLQQQQGARQARTTAVLPSDIVGTWTLKGFQSELHAGVGSWQVSSYVYNGTVEFTADGKYKLTIVESGNRLTNGGESVNAFTNPEAVARGKWKLKGNDLTMDSGLTVKIDAGLSVMTMASANPADNTNVMLVLTKQPAP